VPALLEVFTALFSFASGAFRVPAPAPAKAKKSEPEDEGERKPEPKVEAPKFPRPVLIAEPNVTDDGSCRSEEVLPRC
jgi:hypothetical protein